jgi:YggT family protein
MYSLIDTVFRIYELVVIVRVLFSWIRVDEYHPVAQWVYRLTEPLLEPIRRILPTGRTGIDFSPLLLLLALSVVQQMLKKLFFSF